MVWVFTAASGLKRSSLQVRPCSIQDPVSRSAADARAEVIGSAADRRPAARTSRTKALKNRDREIFMASAYLPLRIGPSARLSKTARQKQMAADRKRRPRRS